LRNVRRKLREVRGNAGSTQERRKYVGNCGKYAEGADREHYWPRGAGDAHIAAPAEVVSVRFEGFSLLRRLVE
jgi:hypothetical protein